jgi:hypothetical protein
LTQHFEFPHIGFPLVQLVQMAVLDDSPSQEHVSNITNGEDNITACNVKIRLSFEFAPRATSKYASSFHLTCKFRTVYPKPTASGCSNGFNFFFVWVVRKKRNVEIYDKLFWDELLQIQSCDRVGLSWGLESSYFLI